MRVETIGPCTLYHGDCLEILPKLDKASVDAVITDPPYGISWNTDYTRFTSGFDVPRRSQPNIENDNIAFKPEPLLSFRRVVLFGANCFSDKLPCGTWLVWDKRFDNGTAFLADGEVAWMNRGHGVYIKRVTQQGFVRPEPNQHPTQKPIAVMAWCIEKAKVPEGGTILDPYMGSGTTGVAAIKEGRKFIGIEIDEGYFDIACKRIERAWEDAQCNLFREPEAVA